jgi:hypothetical protein
MTDDDIQAQAGTFLQGHITSADDLEVLLVLIATRERWCDAASIGAQAGLSPGDARRVGSAILSHPGTPVPRYDARECGIGSRRR